MNSVFFVFVLVVGGGGGVGGYGDCSMIRNGWIFGCLQTLQTQSMLQYFPSKATSYEKMLDQSKLCLEEPISAVFSSFGA